jgi:diguanylate cyclase (GGDEF)-like protein
LLRTVAQRLKDTVRKTDIVARLGGDEFAVALLQVTELEHVGGVADKLIQALARPVEVGGETVTIGASIGIACYPADGAGMDELMRVADAAMYAAKSAGGNAVRHAPASAA